MTYEMIEVEQELSEHELQQIRMRMLVDRLRTTEHSQCFGMLRSPEGGYCGLGEACDLYREETGEGEWVFNRNRNDVTYHFRLEGRGAFGAIPLKVADWYGFPHDRFDDTTSVTIPGLRSLTCMEVSLSSCNDSPMTFDQLADLIQHFFVEVK